LAWDVERREQCDDKVMEIVDRGRGRPIVLVPGIQGRWEWIEPAVDALASQSFRVITFSLCDEPAWGGPLSSPAALDDFCNQIRLVLDERRIERATICGISFGGIIALGFAARDPRRTDALVLVSTPGPGWRLRTTHEIYTRHPWICAPLFFLSAPLRLRRETTAGIPDWSRRWRFRLRQLALLVRAPLSPPRMAARARLIAATDRAADCGQLGMPTLVISGDPDLDHVVTVGGTLEYAQLIPGAHTARLPRTGHLGSITSSSLFAASVREFVEGRPTVSDRGTDAA
jgi:pimeloyl-ACP methyl ester carboxylesterase